MIENVTLNRLTDRRGYKYETQRFLLSSEANWYDLAKVGLYKFARSAVAIRAAEHRLSRDPHKSAARLLVSNWLSAPAGPHQLIEQGNAVSGKTGTWLPAASSDSYPDIDLVPIPPLGWGQNSSVCIATRYRLKGTGFKLGWRKLILSSPRPSVLVLGFFQLDVIFFGRKYTVVFDMIYLLTATRLPPGGSSTIHIYTQTIHRTTQN